jgi:hypothetical protein
MMQCRVAVSRVLTLLYPPRLKVLEDRGKGMDILNRVKPTIPAYTPENFTTYVNHIDQDVESCLANLGGCIANMVSYNSKFKDTLHDNSGALHKRMLQYYVSPDKTHLRDMYKYDPDSPGTELPGTEITIAGAKLIVDRVSDDVEGVLRLKQMLRASRYYPAIIELRGKIKDLHKSGAIPTSIPSWETLIGFRNNTYDNVMKMRKFLDLGNLLIMIYNKTLIKGGIGYDKLIATGGYIEEYPKTKIVANFKKIVIPYSESGYELLCRYEINLFWDFQMKYPDYVKLSHDAYAYENLSKSVKEKLSMSDTTSLWGNTTCIDSNFHSGGSGMLNPLKTDKAFRTSKRISEPEQIRTSKRISEPEQLRMGRQSSKRMGNVSPSVTPLVSNNISRSINHDEALKSIQRHVIDAENLQISSSQMEYCVISANSLGYANNSPTPLAFHAGNNTPVLLSMLSV